MFVFKLDAKLDNSNNYSHLIKILFWYFALDAAYLELD